MRFVEESDSSQARLVIAPLMHASGFLGATNALATGGPVVFCASTSLNPDEILTLIQRYRVRNFGVIGDAIAKPILEALERAEAEGRPYDLSSVETVSNTGGIWSAPVKKGFLRYGDFKISDGLSATEGPGFAIAESTRADEIETAKFRLGPTARIINEQGKDVVPGSGEVGMLATTGRLPKGYLNDPVKTAQAWPTIDGVRYSVPGDLATIEADGTVTLLGRGSEVVNTGGEKVFVEEVETAILSHPAVRDTLVIGLADERWGNRVTAVVALREGSSATDREIIDHVGQELADYKRPRQVVFVAEIPRSPTGKADRPGGQTSRRGGPSGCVGPAARPRGREMNVAVLREADPRPGATGCARSGQLPSRRGGGLVIDDSDRYGVEIALSLRDASGGGEVVARLDGAGRGERRASRRAGDGGRQGVARERSVARRFRRPLERQGPCRRAGEDRARPRHRRDGVDRRLHRDAAGPGRGVPRLAIDQLRDEGRLHRLRGRCDQADRCRNRGRRVRPPGARECHRRHR